MVNINDLILKILHKLPAELSHNIIIKILKYGLLSNNKIIVKNCSTKLNSISFLHPVGIAAGFDKNAETINNIYKTGVSHLEIGTVTPNRQKGNPKPRIFRLIKNRAVINSLGFPSKGMTYVIKQLRNNRSNLPIGINIGCNKDTKDHVKDYTLLTKNLGIYADWITINISSPNTPGLRNLQTSSELLKLLSNIDSERKKIEDLKGNKLQLWLKISPDINDFDLKNLIDNAIKNNMDALSISNTTISRPKSLIYSKSLEQGGLSGKPLFNMSTQILAKSYLHANKEIKFIGVGGIDSAENAFTKILAGASIIQSYTGLSYNGPKLITDIVKYMDTKIKNASLDDFVGIKADEIARNKFLND